MMLRRRGDLAGGDLLARLVPVALRQGSGEKHEEEHDGAAAGGAGQGSEKAKIFVEEHGGEGCHAAHRLTACDTWEH